MPTSASTDLLIAQWRNADNLKALIDLFLSESADSIEAALTALRRMGQIDEAEGVWLDRLGARLGIARPYTSVGADDPRLGFQGATDAVGFDQAPFAGDQANDAVYPLPDVVFRRLIKARAVTVLGDGTFQALVIAARLIDTTASLIDNLDMSIEIVTSERWQFQIADRIGALPRSAGVMIMYRDRQRFGFDDAGLPFDQGYFA